jgi:hypothetical protein
MRLGIRGVGCTVQGVLADCVSLMFLQAIAQFCLLAVVGMILGIACGVSTSYLLEHIFR